MATTLRVKRRATGGSVGAPSTLKTAELAYNMADGKFYIGYGDDGGGNATSVKVLAKDDFLYNIPTGTDGKLLSFSSGAPTWIDPPEGGGVYTAGSGLDLTGSTFSIATGGVGTTHIADGAVTLAKMANIATGSFLGRATASTGVVEVLTGSQAKSLLSLAKTDVGLGNVDNTSDADKPISTATQSALDLKAPLASPALTGTPTAPTAATSTNTTQIATTAFVQAVVAALIDAAPGALDTLNELAAAIGDDPNFATTITNSLAGKLSIASNLSDLNDAATARTNLGLGTIATQNANNVTITGGSIDGVTLDGGTF